MDFSKLEALEGETLNLAVNQTKIMAIGRVQID